jgi:hypothetical protein
VGGLGAALLRHLLPHHRHPRRRAQRQARPHPRDLGAPEGARAPPAAGARCHRSAGRVIPAGHLKSWTAYLFPIMTRMSGPELLMWLGTEQTLLCCPYFVLEITQ